MQTTPYFVCYCVFSQINAKKRNEKINKYKIRKEHNAGSAQGPEV